MNGLFVGATFLLVIFLGVLMSIGSQPEDHQHYVELFNQHPKLEREFGSINEYGSTNKFTAFLYDACLADPACGSR